MEHSDLAHLGREASGCAMTRPSGNGTATAGERMDRTRTCRALAGIGCPNKLRGWPGHDGDLWRRKCGEGESCQVPAGTPVRGGKAADEEGWGARAVTDALARRDADAGTSPGTGPGGHHAGAGTVTGPGEGVQGSPSELAGGRYRHVRAGVTVIAGLVARNRLFAAALGLAAVLRAFVMAGYQPAILIRLDSYFYMVDATRGTPDPDNTGGYAFFLWLVKPFHSLALIAGLQHVMGLIIAVLIYATVRRYGVPRWGAALAAAPVLFDPRELVLEQSIMSDTLATLLMVGAFAVLLSRRSPSVWRSAVAGLLLGAATLVRATALPMIVLVALYLLIRRLGWRRVVAGLVAGVLPVAGYAAWFFTAYGVFSLTNSSGLFLWSRTMSFANCAVIKPPADLAALCPSRNPVKPGKPRPAPYDLHTLTRQATPQDYLWSRVSWPWQPQRAGYEPYTVAFTPENNARAQRFAVRAITAQPLGYATVVAEGVALTFLHTDKNYRWRFPGSQPVTSGPHSGTYRYELAALRAYTGSYDGVTPYLSTHFGTKLVNPFASLMYKYEQVIYLPGVVLGLMFAVVLVGIFFRRRRTGAAVLLWVTAVVALVLPIAVAQYNYRYALAAVPLICMATALVAVGRKSELPPQ